MILWVDRTLCKDSAMKKILAVFILLLPVVYIPNVTTQAATSRSSYVVEVIVIQHNQKNDLEELWSNNITLRNIPDIDKAIEAKGEIPNYSKLTKIAEKISEEKRYRILSHKRWFQYAEPKSKARIIRIRGKENTEPIVDGTFKFYSKYYLHIDVDMRMKEKMDQKDVSPEERSMVYRIRERRRIKIKELNYIDHPKFAMLVYVTPTR